MPKKEIKTKRVLLLLFFRLLVIEATKTITTEASPITAVFTASYVYVRPHKFLIIKNYYVIILTAGIYHTETQLSYRLYPLALFFDLDL
ncbi:MAG TPA: hypothetical protein VE544_06655 [Nitrososphaeraceae archaeon]|nr:hypothetical protein [Nitrososphaeraceae archaeon]